MSLSWMQISSHCLVLVAYAYLCSAAKSFVIRRQNCPHPDLPASPDQRDFINDLTNDVPFYSGQSLALPSAAECGGSPEYYVKDEDAATAEARLLSGGLKAVELSTIYSNAQHFGPEAAFDGDRLATLVHTESEINPWIKGDLGASYKIVGALFFNRANCCGERIKNLHFHVSAADPSMSSYSATLCHVYHGPAMQDGEIRWLPCLPHKSGRWFMLEMHLSTADHLSFNELEIFGY